MATKRTVACAILLLGTLGCASPIGIHMKEKVIPASLDFVSEIGPGIGSALFETAKIWFNKVKGEAIEASPESE